MGNTNEQGRNSKNAKGKTGVQRNYKDTVFRMIFREKENLLSLYNALNGTAYEETDALEITTLENAVYMNYKNDISFVFDFELLLYEHQSTCNPNMPLRDLIYVTGYYRIGSKTKTYTASRSSGFLRPVCRILQRNRLPAGTAGAVSVGRF